jgi:hypothetical protein
MANPANRPAAARRALALEQLEDRTTPAFGAFGGLSVADGDVYPNPGIGLGDYVMGSGPGVGPLIRVFDAAGNLQTRFFAFDPGFRGGVWVATGDVTGDGRNEIIATPASQGGPVVAIFRGDGQLLRTFFAAEPSFRGGLPVAVGNTDGAGPAEIIVGAGDGGGPVVRVFSGGGRLLSSFYAFESSFRGGVNVAAGNVDGDAQGGDEILVGAGPGGSSLVKIFDHFGNLQRAFFAFDTVSRVGVTVAAGDTDGLVGDEIFVTPNNRDPRIRVFAGPTGRLVNEISPFADGFTGRLNMAVGDVTQDGFGDLIVVSGEDVISQQPRLYFGAFNRPATTNGP